MLLKAKKLYEETIRIRRYLHSFPEAAFLEYNTASFIINYLKELGFDVSYANQVSNPKYIMDLPDVKKQETCMEKAINNGADKDLVYQMKDGMTGVVATINTNRNGKTVAFRFDMDANEISETNDLKHLANKLSFSSKNDNVMHACGHDGHVAIGLSLAKLISQNLHLFNGKIKLIFQPAEEGVRGANAMVYAGVVDDVDYFFSGHIGIKAKDNDSFVCYSKNFLATSRYLVNFIGLSSHAALAPENGKNALLASCHATLALHSIAQNGKGLSRVNVGILNSGTSHNVVPDFANMVFQVRGESNVINNELEEKAIKIIKHAALMYDVDVNIKKLGFAKAISFNDNFSNELFDYCKKMNIYNNVIKEIDMGASEDATLFMERVTSNGGKAAYMMFGSKLANQHHNNAFDFDESVLYKAIAIYANLALKYCK